MSQAKGEGATSVAPVSENAPRWVAGDAVNGFGNVLESGLKQFTHSQAAEQEQMVAMSYAGRLSSLAQWQAQGEPEAVINMHRRRLNAEIGANYPHLIEKIEKIRGFFEGNTELKTAIDQEKLKQETRAEEIKSAAKDGGFVIVPGMSERHLDDIVELHQKDVARNKAMDRMIRQNTEIRAQNQENRTQAQYDMKQVAIKNLRDMGNDHLEYTSKFLKEALDDIGKNPDLNNLKKWDLAFTTHFSKLDNATASLGAHAPEVAGMYKQMFGQLREFASKMTNPSTKSEEIKAEYERLRYGIQANILSNMTVSEQTAFGLSNMFANSSAVQLGISVDVAGLAQKLTAKNPIGIPNPIGNPKEADLFKLVNATTTNVFNGKSGNTEKDKEDLANFANNTLKQVQTTHLINGGMKPQELKHVASWLASPEFAQIVSTGKVDKDSLANVKKVFQVAYDEHINRGVLEKLDSTVSAGSADAPKPTKLSKFVDISFDGAGVSFKAKPVDPESPLASHLKVNSINKELEASTAAINQVIRIGAHMEGTTDYRKYWEENKHIIMRGYFRKGQEPGKPVPDNPDYIYVGGDARDPDNYMRRIKDGSKPS